MSSEKDSEHMDVLITYIQFAAVTVLHSFLRQNTKKYKIDLF